MLIRAASAADIPALRALDLASPFGARWTDSHYQSFFAPDSTRHLVVAVEAEGTIIAYLVASGVGKEWELENVVVSPEHLRRGIGRALIEELLGRLRSESVSRLFLEVRESNTAARALYASLGFSETNRRTAYYSNPAEDALVLSRTL